MTDYINDPPGVKYKFSKRIKPVEQKKVKAIISELQKSAGGNSVFFDDLNVDVYRRWKDSEDEDINTLPRLVSGAAYPQIKGEGSRIAVKMGLEDLVMFEKKGVKQTIAHEMGHAFDMYFATPDEQLIETLTAICTNSENAPECSYEEYQQMLELYYQQNGLSDSEEFREAWRKDVEENFKGRSAIRNGILTNRLGYYSPSLDFHRIGNTDKKQKIELSDGIDDQELDAANRAREEAFAQLFAYAMGVEGHREKELMLKVYKNSYEVVKNFINKFLNTESLDNTDNNTSNTDVE